MNNLNLMGAYIVIAIGCGLICYGFWLVRPISIRAPLPQNTQTDVAKIESHRIVRDCYNLTIDCIISNNNSLLSIRNGLINLRGQAAIEGNRILVADIDAKLAETSKTFRENMEFYAEVKKKRDFSAE